MSEYLSASDLAEQVKFEANQKAMMVRWLNRQGWRYVLNENGLPRALRAYRDKKLRVVDGEQKASPTSSPNRQAFARVGKDRNRTPVQVGRQAAH